MKISIPTEITADEKEKETANRVEELGDSIDESIVVETDWSRMYTVRPIMQGEELTVYYTGY